MQRKMLLCVLLLFCSGCAVPLPDKVSSGHKHSGEALHFLALPDTTREEVIATLGPPLVEVAASGVLLYSWETTSRYLFIYPKSVHRERLETGASVEHGDPEQWGLFIHYNNHGVVTAHQVQEIGTDGLEEACVKWATSKGIR